MIKALFVHDHPFYKYNERFYSTGALPANIWDRYLSVFDELTVVARGRSTNCIVGLSLSSSLNVSFELFYDITGGIDYLFKKQKIKQHLRPLVQAAEVIILRLPSFFGDCAVEVCNELKKPYAVEVVGCIWDSNWNHGSLIGKLRAPLAFVQMRRAIRNAAATIYVTEHFLQKRYPTSAKVISYASNVYIDDFNKDVLRMHHIFLVRKKDSYKLALLANLQVRYKGFEVIFRALQLAKEKLNKPIKLYLYGAGESNYVDNLIDKYGLKSNVHIMGPLNSGEDVYGMLDELDLYVQPSLTEGLPRAVIEAMSRGCPVLASSAGGTPELLNDEFLHAPGDYKKLSEQIVECLLNSDLLLQMSEANFYKAKNYTASILNERRTIFLEKLKLFI